MFFDKSIVLQKGDYVNKKIEKYGFCNTIIIRKIADADAAILLQNAFPILEKNILCEYL